MALSATSSSSSIFEANDFQSGAWRTVSTQVREHIDPGDAPGLARALAASLSRQSQWRYALGRSTTSVLELRDRLRPFLARELNHIIRQGPNTSTVLSSADGHCVAVWRRQRGGGFRIAREMFKRWPVGDVLHALRFLNELEKSHPKEPHVYLEAFGTMQGADADKVMEEMTRRLDREGTRAYAECAAGEDVGFLMSHGFRVLHRRLPHLPRGAPNLVGLWRLPKDAAVQRRAIDDSLAEVDDASRLVKRKPRTAIDEDRRDTR